MGTTANNVQVFVGDTGTAEEVATALRASPLVLSALVSPATGGWVSVFPESQDFGDPSLALELSTALGRPCVNFFCFDSDIAVAMLAVSGGLVGQLTCCWPGLAEEMGMGDTGPTLEGIEGEVELSGDVDAWIETIGRSSRGEIVAAVRGDSPFAEESMSQVMSTFGISAERLVMAHRFYMAGEHDNDRSAFLIVD